MACSVIFLREINSAGHSDRRGWTDMIDTVVFDIGNVLMKFDYLPFVKKLLGDAEAVEKVNKAIFLSHLWDELDRGRDTDEIFQKMIEEEPGYEDQIRLTFDSVGECMEREEYAVPWIRDLKKRGYRVLYLSNYSPHTMEANIDVLNFVPFMDGGIFSCDVKRIKPDPEIFRILIRKYSLDPENCIFIDDNKDNVDTALSLGMHAIHFIDYDSAKSELEEVLTDQEQHNENT